MRKSTTQILAASLVVAVATAPAMLSAQDETPINEVSLTDEQQAVYDGWAPDMKLAYATWPNDTKEYFWTLSDARQKLFWKLTDEDKLAITAMAEPEREKAWTGIEAAAGGTPSAETGADESIN